jgi:hypothetical protein
MPLLLTAAVFVLPRASASASTAPDIPATAPRFYNNIRVTAGDLVAGTDAPCPTGEFVIPRLGRWPSSGLRSLSASQSFEPVSSSEPCSLDTSQHYEPKLSLASASKSPLTHLSTIRLQRNPPSLPRRKHRLAIQTRKLASMSRPARY